MSMRVIASRVLQNARILLRCARNQEYPRNVDLYRDNVHIVEVGKRSGARQASGAGLSFIGAQARRIFVDNVLRRVTNSLAANLRKRAANRFLLGDSTPFFAFVGVSLASGTGLLTKDEELEGVCWEIREAVSKLQWNKPCNDVNHEAVAAAVLDEAVSCLKQLTIGPVIAKGCSAVVYAARSKKPEEDEGGVDVAGGRDLARFPFAIKMMFNYDAESCATAIFRSMYRETVPARQIRRSDERMAEWQRKMAENKKSLPAHPNIVAMYCAFADRVPALPGSALYTDALPARIHPDGAGRNMSLFLLMRRYDLTLKEYVKSRQLSMRESILLFAQLLEGLAHMNAHGIAHRDLKSDNILLDLSEESDNCPSLVISDFGCCLADKQHGLHLPYHSHDTDKGGNAALMAPEVVDADPGPFSSINYTKADVWTVGTIAYEIFGLDNPFYGNGKNGLKNYDYSDDALPPLPADVPQVVANLVRNMLWKSRYKRLDAEMAATIMQLFLWAPSSWLTEKSKLPSSNEMMQWLLCLTTKVLCEGRSFSQKQRAGANNDSERQSNRKSSSTRTSARRTMPEYQLIASFLGRVSLGNVRRSLKWLHRN